MGRGHRVTSYTVARQEPCMEGWSVLDEELAPVKPPGGGMEARDDGSVSPCPLTSAEL